jgi:hypothetical protein
MEDFDEKLKLALGRRDDLSEEKLATIRKDSRAMFEKEKRNNNQWTICLMLLGFLLICVWGWLFYQSENVKFQILWATFLVGEGLGLAIVGMIHLLIHNDLTTRGELREIELQLAEMREEIKAG